MTDLHTVKELGNKFANRNTPLGDQPEEVFKFRIADLQALIDHVKSLPQDARDIFERMISEKDHYAFYLFQWVPYQTEAKRWRVKLLHDVKTFDGREATGVYPNGNHLGPFKDEEVEFIRVSTTQWDSSWVPPTPTSGPITQEQIDEFVYGDRMNGVCDFSQLIRGIRFAESFHRVGVK